MYRNIAIIQNVVTAMRPFRSDTLLLLVANPVDLLTSLALDLSGLPTSQVLGSGTFLDSARVRGLLADKAQASSLSFCIPVQTQLIKF
jgi:L-lactate dehydrogenase